MITKNQQIIIYYISFTTNLIQYNQKVFYKYLNQQILLLQQIMGNTCIEDQPIAGEIEDIEHSELDKKNLELHRRDRPSKAYAILKEHPKLVNQPTIHATKNQIIRKGGQLKAPAIRGNELPAFYIKDKHVYYIGEWLRGKPNGKGKVYMVNGTYFEGGFRDGTSQCEDGILIYPDGSYYRGHVEDSKFNGQGEFYYKTSGMLYRGMWKNDKPEGKGEQIFVDGSKYVGDFKNGWKEGFGKFTWPDGKEYQGFWKQGYMHGKGTLKKGKGKFDGEFENGLKKIGYMQTEYGTYYGKFVNGEMHDIEGKFVWNDQKEYKGQFKNGQIDGKGVMTYKNDQRVQGYWKKGENIKVENISR